MAEMGRDPRERYPDQEFVFCPSCEEWVDDSYWGDDECVECCREHEMGR